MAKKKKEETKFKFKPTERFLRPDVRHGNLIVSKFINQIMWDGKKSTAERVFYRALDTVGKRIKDVEPLEVFQQALNNVKPVVEVRSKRVGGATYQVPMEVNRRRQQTLAIRQLVTVARGRKGKPMAERLADEIVAAFKKEGAAIQWRENVHKMAESNKLFAHFAW